MGATTLTRGQARGSVRVAVAARPCRRAAATSAACRGSVAAKAASGSGSAPPLPAALLFDCDGVLVDTERDGHRVSFNRAFKEMGLGEHEWDVDLYGKVRKTGRGRGRGGGRAGGGQREAGASQPNSHQRPPAPPKHHNHQPPTTNNHQPPNNQLLEIGGGKERMTAYFAEEAAQRGREPFLSRAPDPASQKALVADLHALKTDLFMTIVERREMPLRPGVARLVHDAIRAGVPVAVCSTSNERAVSTIVRVMLGEEVASTMRVFAGDIVPKKKPDPAIYLLAAKELGVDPRQCVVVEDSGIGLRAAKAAGCACVVTKSSYTGGEDFTAADAVHDCIGDEGEERFSLGDLARLLQQER
jgi:HAD superfamily hydrolase (TIGR01509 family)